MNLGGRLKMRREHLGWTQVRVVNEVNALRSENDSQPLSQQNLGLLERRDSQKSAYVHELAIVLRTNVSWLLKGVGDPDAQDEPEDASAYARYLYENFDKLPPIRQQLVREIFSNWGGPEGPHEEEKVQSPARSENNHDTEIIGQ